MLVFFFFFFLQWPTQFSRRGERREGGREKLVANALPRHDREHAPHHHDRGGEVQQTPP
jgi:hypothetical protein